MKAPLRPDVGLLPRADRQWRAVLGLTLPLGLAAAPLLLALDSPLCLFRASTGLPCPLCGGTHAAAALAHGDLGAAWQSNPGVTVLLVVSIAHAVVLVAEALSGRTLGATAIGAASTWRRVWLLTGSVLGASWMVRLMGA